MNINVHNYLVIFKICHYSELCIGSYFLKQDLLLLNFKNISVLIRTNTFLLKFSPQNIVFLLLEEAILNIYIQINNIQHQY